MTDPTPLSNCICLCSPSLTKWTGTVGETRTGKPSVKLGSQEATGSR